MGTMHVGLGERSYPIVIEQGCLQRLPDELAQAYPASCYCLVADETVGRLYGERLRDTLQANGQPVQLLTFPAGETSKCIDTVATLASSAARLQLDRTTMFIALGGGVTGDIAGFLASAYMRGVPFVQVPTSLLAQVDSSVGGKTGVDLPEGKNLFGAFYQPKAVFIDPDVLRTLPYEQLCNGLAEVIKYGIIKEPLFLDYLEQQRENIFTLDPKVISAVIQTCCRIKAEVVAADEREGGMRRILNFGHTIGHAVESASDFALLHGFAVAIGMVAAVRIGVRRALLEPDLAQRLIELIASYDLPTEIPAALDRNVIKSYFLSDKKRVDGRLFFVLPRDDGDVIITDEVSAEDIEAVLNT